MDSRKQINLRLTPEAYNELCKQAGKRYLSVNTYVQTIIKRHLDTTRRKAWNPEQGGQPNE